MGATGSASKSSNDSGASDSSIDAVVVPVASTAKDSAVVAAAATRATKALMAPVLPGLVADVDAPDSDPGSGTTAEAVADAGAVADVAAAPPAFNVGAEVAQRPDVDAAVALDEGAEIDKRPDVDVLDDAGVAAAVEAEFVALADGAPMVGVCAPADERPAEDVAAIAGGADDELLGDELPGTVGRGGGFAAGGGDAAGAGRAGGTNGIADLEIGLPTVAARGAVLGLTAEGGASRLSPSEPPVVPEGSCCAAGEPGFAIGAADCAAGEPPGTAEGADGAPDELGWGVDGAGRAPDEPACDADEGGRAAGEAAAEDDALPAVGPGLNAEAVRAPEIVVELTGRVAAPTGAGPAGARAPVPGCVEVVDAPISLTARSPAALAASPTRAPGSETLWSVAEVAREEGPAAEMDGPLAAGALAAAPPIPGIPNPAGDVGFSAAVAVWPAPGSVDEEGEVGAEVCGVFTDGAAGADVDACDVAPEEVGAEAPWPAESVSTGPSGSNN